MTSPSAPDPSSINEELVVEAATAEEALAEVTELLGERAEILSAEKVHRGGIGGFFAREAVRLTARPRGGVVPRPTPPEVPASEGAGTSSRPSPTPDAAGEPDAIAVTGGLDAVLARMQEEVDEREVTFVEALRRHMEPGSEPAGGPPADGDTSTVAEPGPSADSGDASTVAERGPSADSRNVSSPASPSVVGATPRSPLYGVDLDAPEGTGRIQWSQQALARLGLPESVIEAVAGLDPRDELAWLSTLAASVAPLCRPLPSGSAVVVGPRAHRLAEPLGVPLVSRPDLPPYGGTVVLRTDDSPPGREWVAEVRGDRWLHLVAGGRGWLELADDDEPLALSWVGDRALPEAVRMCTRLGLVLGFGCAGGSHDPVVRATPIEVAVTLRGMLSRA